MKDTLPRRRWYQFRLSTVLVLVAISAWAMAYWPWGKSALRSFDYYQPYEPGIEGRIYVRQGLGLSLGLWRSPPHTSYRLECEHIPGQLMWPASALIAFLTWKWTWPRVVRWRERRRERATES